MISFDAPGNLPRRTMMLTAAGFPDRRDGMALANEVQKPLSTLLARCCLRGAEAEFMGLDGRMLKDIGLDCNEIGSALMDDAQERANGMRRSTGRIV